MYCAAILHKKSQPISERRFLFKGKSYLAWRDVSSQNPHVRRRSSSGKPLKTRSFGRIGNTALIDTERNSYRLNWQSTRRFSRGEESNHETFKDAVATRDRTHQTDRVDESEIFHSSEWEIKDAGHFVPSIRKISSIWKSQWVRILNRHVSDCTLVVLYLPTKLAS